MAKKKFERIVRSATDAEKKRHAIIRKEVMKEIPPASRKPAPPGYR